MFTLTLAGLTPDLEPSGMVGALVTYRAICSGGVPCTVVGERVSPTTGAHLLTLRVNGGRYAYPRGLRLDVPIDAVRRGTIVVRRSA